MLPTGQQVRHLLHPNGTEEWWFCAGGAPGFSADLLLHLLDELIPDPEGWRVLSCEIFTDDYGARVEGGTAITLQEWRGIVLKGYLHQGHPRIEAAFRETIPLEDFYRALLGISGFVNNREALREVTTLRQEQNRVREELARIGTRTERTRQLVTSVSNRLEERTGPGKGKRRRNAGERGANEAPARREPLPEPVRVSDLMASEGVRHNAA